MTFVCTYGQGLGVEYNFDGRVVTIILRPCDIVAATSIVIDLDDSPVTDTSSHFIQARIEQEWTEH